jgi:hypothetical protein
VETARVVEVLHDRGETVSPRWLLGSGFVIRADVIITAAHNLGDSAEEHGPFGTIVRTLDGVELPANILVRSDSLDLALLAASGLKAAPVKLGQVDQEHIDVVREVMAVGFPNYKYADERPPSQKRQPAQPVGSVPTAEGVSGGDLTLKVEAGEPAPLSSGGSSPWEGLSGAGVFVHEYLFGIVVEHHLAEGLGALRLIPLSRILDLPPPDGAMFRAILGLDHPGQLDLIGVIADVESGDDPVLSDIINDLQEVIDVGRRGLLTAAEVSALKITAYKEAKGWK